MRLFLENTSYQEFDAWLTSHAKSKNFIVSYDELCLKDDLGDIISVPKAQYPLKIYLSKIYPGGVSYDWDVFFIVEKSGSNLWVIVKFIKSHENIIQPILDAIWDYWPGSKQGLKKEPREKEIKQKREAGKPHLKDDIWAYREMHEKNRVPKEVYDEWLELPGVKDRNLQDPERQFDRLKIKEWLE